MTRSIDTMQRPPKPLVFGLTSSKEVGDRIDRIRARAERDRKRAAAQKKAVFTKPTKAQRDGKIR
jgi:hypothetical protein